MAAQLALAIELRDDATLENYVAPQNAEVIAKIESLSLSPSTGSDNALYLWGAPSSGKTHLLQAACHTFSAHDKTAAYLPLALIDELQPAMLDNMEQLALVCIDDLNVIAGRSEWELALFHFFNRARAAGTALIFAADTAPAYSTIHLADLRSRLAAMLVLHIHSLSDVEKLAALQLRANRRGLELSTEVGRFLLHRAPRDMRDLFDLLDRLDKASLQAQRRLSIPFVKEVLAQ